MLRRLVMLLLGVVVGLAIGHALGYHHAKYDDRDELMMMRQIIESARGMRRTAASSAARGGTQ